MISLARIGSANERAQARVRKPASVYDDYLTERFPDKQHKDLPIIGQDFTYYMDIMFLNSLVEENRTEMKKRVSRGINIREEDELHKRFGYAPSYSCALIIIEGTTRKAWAFPLHTKDAKEVLFAFKIFLSNIDMKIAKLVSDKGKEYNKIKAYNEAYNLFHYFQVVASQNMHTTLSRVDRFIRTLRDMIKQYYRQARNPSWVMVLKLLVDRYNNTPHSSLFLKDPTHRDRKIFYTPQQVWKNPELRRRIKLKDYLAKYKNYRRLDRDLSVGTHVRYRVLPKTMKSRNQKGYLSQYVAIIRQKMGNSYEIQLKTNDDIVNDEIDHENTHFSGDLVTVPARDLVPDKERRGNSKYNFGDLFIDHPPSDDDDNDDNDDDDDDDDAPPPPPPPVVHPPPPDIHPPPVSVPRGRRYEGDRLRAEAGWRNLPTTEKRTRRGNSRYFNGDFESYQIGRN